MRISVIAAVAENGVIGRGGKLPWRLSADLWRFKSLTMGHTIIMGRRTWESIGRPLPGRRMIVVSRQPDYRVTATGVQIAQCLDDALNIAATGCDDEAFVIGGAETYRDALPMTDRIYLTRVHADVVGDTWFPDVDWRAWALSESESHEADAKNDYPYTFETYRLVAAKS